MVDKNLDEIQREEKAWQLEQAFGEADRAFYERIGRLRQASETWFSPGLQTDLNILIEMAEKYREHARNLSSAEHQKSDQT